ncbi:glycosyltransferase [Lysobacter capsici]|uniref:glycosyltransferase n=1 Tax=Lysobacter capsici TaxID=435897 RepID=UPI000627C0DA|nr:glycosyltransferase [Lysobacter capsici]
MRATPPSADPTPALRDYRDALRGADIVVCGCGPSLLELPRPRELLTIGVNDVGRLFDPTYLVVLNPRQQFKGDRYAFVERSNARVLFTQLELGAVRPPVVRFRLGQYGGVDAEADGTLHYSQNSPYVAVRLAALMGARRIGLIGVDFTDDHFFAITGRHSLAGRLKEIDAQYGRLAGALRRGGVELVNLSSISRLTALPRGRIDDAAWYEHAASAATTAQVRASAEPVALPVPAPARIAQARSPSMKVAIEKRSAGLVGDLLDTLAGSVAELGHTVVRDPRASARNPRVLSIVWNGRGYSTAGPTLYCEHGWLPRWDYQISPRGINADSHAAPFAWDGQPLDGERDAQLEHRLQAIKSTEFSGYYQYMQASGPAASNLPAQFLLVPLQIESDTNIVRHAPARLRTMQALIDHVSRLDPPWPVIFKQHPADARTGNRHLRLQLRRKQDLLWPQTRGNIHEMLRSGACRGILTLNSNVAHDGLLWDVPAIVLGRNVWPSRGENPPFLTDAPRDWSRLQASVDEPQARACRRAYAQYLIAHQVSLAEAADPQRVAGLLELALRERPMPRTGSVIARPPPRAIATRAIKPQPPAPPVINVVAEHKGWLFEHWKQALAATPLPGYRVAASERPLAQADAWIFLRASEAGRAPDPMRSLAQLHDLGGAELYRSGGVRADVARCGGLMLAHPDQQRVLAEAGIDLSRRRWRMQPVGWGDGAPLSVNRDAAANVGWVGRPGKWSPDATSDSDPSGLSEFVAAVKLARRPLRVVLIGERLDAAARELKRAGIDCALWPVSRHPLTRCAEWIARLDAVVVNGRTDCSPWPLFDALRAGVPVIAPRVGWTPQWLGDGERGRLVDDVAAMAQAIDEVVGQRDAWRQRRQHMPPQCPEFGMRAWLDANLRLAVELAERQAEDKQRAVA